MQHACGGSVMHTQSKSQRGFTWIEVIVCLVILVMLARYIWAGEFLEAENQFIASLGFQPWVKYLITFPLFGAWLVWKYRQESSELVGTGKPVVRSSLLVFAITALGAISIYLFYLSRVGYA